MWLSEHLFFLLHTHDSAGIYADMEVATVHILLELQISGRVAVPPTCFPLIKVCFRSSFSAIRMVVLLEVVLQLSEMSSVRKHWTYRCCWSLCFGSAHKDGQHDMLGKGGHCTDEGVADAVWLSDFLGKATMAGMKPATDL